MTTSDAASTNAPPRMPVMQGLITLGVVVVLIAGYIVTAAALGLSGAWIGFLFLLYWSGIDHMRTDRLAPDAIGMFFGLGLSWLLHYLSTGPDPTQGQLIFLAVILVTVFIQIMNLAPWVVNLPAMLVLTVGAIPHIQEHADFQQLFLGLALGVAFFTITVTVVVRLAAMMASRKADAASVASGS